MNEKPDDKAAESKPPGPTDQGRVGGMATREVAPEVVQRHQHESED